MSEEAYERLVRLYLESEGYLVLTNKKFKLKTKTKAHTKTGKSVFQEPSNEVDIIAIDPKNPANRILGEVKGWRVGLSRFNFSELCNSEEHQKYERNIASLHLINDKGFQGQLLSKVEEAYGQGFKIMLFCHHIKDTHKERILALAKQENFEIVESDVIIKGLLQAKNQVAYSNEPVMQLLRMMEDRGFVAKRN